MWNGNGCHSYHANSVRRGIRIPVARVQDVRSYEKTQDRAALEARLNGRVLKLGKCSILHRLDRSTGPRLEHDRDAAQDVRAALVLSKETQSPPKRKNTTCMPPQSAPLGVAALCPACDDETSIRLIEPMNAQGVERRTFECKQCHERQAFIVARVSEITHVMRH